MNNRIFSLFLFTFVIGGVHVNAWESKLTITEMNELKNNLAENLEHDYARKAGAIGILARPPERQDGRFLQASVFRHPDTFVLIHITEVKNNSKSGKEAARVCIVADKLNKSQFEALTKYISSISGVYIDAIKFPCVIKDVGIKLWEDIDTRLKKFGWGEDVKKDIKSTLKVEREWGFIESNFNGAYTCYVTDFRGDAGKMPNIQGMLFGLESFLRVHLTFSAVETTRKHGGDSKKTKNSDECD